MTRAVQVSSADGFRWYRLGTLTEVPPRGARVAHVQGRQVAVFRTSTDAVFALLDRCPHRGGPLSQGIVHGDCVTCPLHDWVIDLTSGEARGPDEGKAESFPVRVEAGEILLGIPREDSDSDDGNGGEEGDSTVRISKYVAATGS